MAIPLKNASNASFREDLKFYEELKPEDYITDRLIFKIKLYFKLARRCEKFYNANVFFTLCFGALVPVVMNWDLLKQVNVFGSADLANLLATVFSIIVIILVSLETTFNFREKLQNYKKAEDQLTNELYLYQSDSEPYNIEGPDKENKNFQLLVFRVESMIKKEREDTIEKVTAHVVEKSIPKPNE